MDHSVLIGVISLLVGNTVLLIRLSFSVGRYAERADDHTRRIERLEKLWDTRRQTIVRSVTA